MCNSSFCSNGNKCVYLLMLQTSWFAQWYFHLLLTVHCSALYVIVIRFYSVFQHLSVFFFVIFNIEKRRVGRHHSKSLGVPKNTKEEDGEKSSNFCGCKSLSIFKHSENVVVVCRMEVSLFSLQLFCCANENNRQIGSMHSPWTMDNGQYSIIMTKPPSRMQWPTTHFKC